MDDGTRTTRLAWIMAAFFCSALALAGCSSGGEEEITYVERSPEDLYNAAVNALDAGDTTTAAALFDEVDRQHPYSQWAARGQTMAGFAHYQGRRYDAAIITLDRFIQLNPGHEDISYAYYLRALCYYEQISDVERDQGLTERALEALTDVVQRFPDTDYATDARLKRDLTLDQLAGKNMAVGRYYQRQGHHVAAIGRFRSVIDDFQTTNHVPEALHRLTESYLALGLTVEARRIAAVLGHNFPGSEWYIDSYAILVDGGVRPDEDGVIDQTLDWLF